MPSALLLFKRFWWYLEGLGWLICNSSFLLSPRIRILSYRLPSDSSNRGKSGKRSRCRFGISCFACWMCLQELFKSSSGRGQSYFCQQSKQLISPSMRSPRHYLQESQNATQKDHCIWGCMVTVRPQNCGSCRAQCDTRPYPAFPSLTTFECLFQRNLLLSLRQKETFSYKTYMLYGV